MQKAHDVARSHLLKVAERQEHRYDIRARYDPFKEGDFVWLKNETREVGVCPKLQLAYLGPYIVTAVRGNVNYRVQLDEKGKSRVFHFDKLKKYQGVNPPKWLKKVAKGLILGTKSSMATQTEA